MSKTEPKGTYQLPNGTWAFRAFLVVDGVKKDVKRTKDEFGKPFKTEKSALEAREVFSFVWIWYLCEPQKEECFSIKTDFPESCIKNPLHFDIKHIIIIVQKETKETFCAERNYNYGLG